MGVVVIVPWGGGCPHRERAWRWARERWRGLLAAAEPVLAPAPPGPWCKAAAAMPTVQRARAEIVCVADADVWCDGVSEAIAAVEAGATWAVPHDQIYRLTEAATAAVLAGADWRGLELDRFPYQGRWGGGIVVARRQTLLDVPLDPRFTGWGQEDESWGVALHFLAGEAWRGTAPLVHLWHPPQDRLTPKTGSLEGKALWRRYLAARADRGQMRNLIEEAKRAARELDQPQVHDLPA
jgi:hypothetical protein